MNDITRKYLNNFIADFESAKKICRWDGAASAATMAATFIGNDLPTDINAITKAQQVIKKNAGVFSGLRFGYARNIVTAAVSMADDQESAIKTIAKIEADLKPGMFESFQWIICATMIYLNSENGDYETAVNRTRMIYNDIAKNHPIIGGSKHVANCALLAMSDKDPIYVSEEYEECYKELIKIYGKGSASLYAAAAMSLFGGGADIKAEKVKMLHQTLKGMRFHFTTDGLEIIALISGLFGENPQDILRDMVEVSNELSKVKGMGAWGVGDKVRNMLAATIVIDACTEDRKEACFAKQAIMNILCQSMSDNDTTAVMVTTM